jgi:hypothetical protein
MKTPAIAALLEKELGRRVIKDYKMFSPVSLDDLAEVFVWVRFVDGEEESYRLRIVK